MFPFVPEWDGSLERWLFAGFFYLIALTMVLTIARVIFKTWWTVYFGAGRFSLAKIKRAIKDLGTE